MTWIFAEYPGVANKATRRCYRCERTVYRKTWPGSTHEKENCRRRNKGQQTTQDTKQAKQAPRKAKEGQQ